MLLNYARRQVFFVKQFWTICRWVQNEVRASTVIQLELPWFSKEIFFIVHSPAKLQPVFFNPPEAQFIISFFENNPKKKYPGLQLIFRLAGVEVFEKITESETAPIRRGLNENEKEISLKTARDALYAYIKEKKELPESYFFNLSKRLFLEADVDVQLWVNGELRGSQIVEKQPYIYGVVQSTLRSSRDPRFKPISSEDLPNTRIQITILQSLRLFLDGQNKSIFPDKGYLLKHKDRRGWFLPAVFNVRKFQDFADFFHALTRKAGLQQFLCRPSEVCVFEVEDFVESSDTAKPPLSLYGPAPKPKFYKPDSFDVLRNRLCLAADWLCEIQENEGYLPKFIDPIRGKSAGLDWGRMAFSAWALAEFGKAAKKEQYSLAARKTFLYLIKHLQGDESYRAPLPAFVYLGQLASALGELTLAQRVGEKLLKSVLGAPFEPIFYGAAANFFLSLPQNEEIRGVRQKILSSLEREFIKSRKNNLPMSLASWAELANAFSEEEFSQDVCEWLKRQQLSNGAFPNTSADSNFTYTRGTGKIFEVLTIWPDYSYNSIWRAFSWLAAMQYDEDSSYFIPKDRRQKLLGGFRHDYFNCEAWVDSAGHFLRGGSRLLTWMNKKNA